MGFLYTRIGGWIMKRYGENNRMGIAGKVAIVTGAAAGIGRGAARAFALEGARVVVADLETTGGEETVRLIEEAGGEASFARCDVSKESDVEALVARAVRLYGSLDFAFNNAGIGPDGVRIPVQPIVESPADAWMAHLDVNLTGIFFCLKYEMRQMMKQRQGAIVNCSSLQAIRSVRGFAGYGATKTGLLGLTRVAALEGGTGALGVASGMAAITYALLAITRLGDEIVAANNLYGGTYQLFHHTFPKLGRTVKFVDSRNPAAFRNAITAKTRAVYVEAIAKIAHDNGIPLVADNTVGIGLVRPFEHGADIIVASATKYIGGHGTSIGGVIVDSGQFRWDNGKFPEFTEPDPSYHGIQYWDALGNVPGMGNVAFILKIRLTLLRDLGAALSPFNAHELLLGLETLPLRQKRHSENALALAQWLQKHPRVRWVTYPGLENDPGHALAAKYLKQGYGGLVGFGIQGGLEAGKKFINHVQLLSHLANIGDAKTLVIHPASTTHQQLTEEEQRETGVTADYIRLSVGLEDLADIQADIDQALQQTNT